VARFKEALDYDLNIELYNYCAFRAGEIMNDLGDWPGIIAHFMAYIERNREESNLPLAVYWIVKAKWQQGERQGALDFFQESVAKYGAERTALGIDVLLEEWVALSRQLSEDESRKAWGRLRELMTAAGVEGKPALALRLQRLRLYQPGLEAGDKALILNDILREDNLAAAPPGVLELMMDEGARAGKPELAVKAAELLVKDFPETDYALSARMMLARLAGEAGDYDAAIRHLSVVREVFATSSEAAEALYTLGNIHLTRRQFDEADRCFSELLGVKEWRGPLWPAALYGRGEAARLRGKPAEASAYYERIYVMYGNYTEWVAKAYLQRAACLIRLHEPGKAEETLAEMLANPSLGDAPEAAQAKEMLGKLKGESL